MSLAQKSKCFGEHLDREVLNSMKLMTIVDDVHLCPFSFVEKGSDAYVSPSLFPEPAIGLLE